MRKIFLLTGLLLAQVLLAQNDPFFSHYMFNPAYYNPGWIGDVNSAFATFQHRSQWAGYGTTYDGSGGAPNSQLMTFAIPMQGTLSAAGLNIIHDRLGIESTMKVQLGAAYSLELRRGTLSFGVMPSLISRTLRFDMLRFEDPSEPLNTGERETQMRPDLAAGVFYRSYSGYFGGVGVDHILSPSLINVEADGQQLRGQLIPTYYFHGGKSFELSRDVELTPTVLAKTDLTGYSIDVSGMVNYKASMWGGFSYRRGEAVVMLVGYSFLENKTLNVGYSFDYVVQNQEAKRPTSHEVYIRYELPSMILGGRKAVKTPRFSF